jgi:hypothetical protein
MKSVDELKKMIAFVFSPEEIEPYGIVFQAEFNDFMVIADKIEKEFGFKFLEHTLKFAKKSVQNNHLIIENNVLKTTKSGKFLTDGLASELFLV